MGWGTGGQSTEDGPSPFSIPAADTLPDSLSRILQESQFSVFWVTAEQTDKMFFWQRGATWSHSRTEDGRAEKAPAPPSSRWVAVKHRGQRLALSRDRDDTHPLFPLQEFLLCQSGSPSFCPTPALAFFVCYSIVPDSISVLDSWCWHRGHGDKQNSPVHSPVCLTV